MLITTSSRSCFALEWYDDEAEAIKEGAAQRKRGATINGGFMHGMPCDRVPEFDYTDEATGKKLYAVRTP